MSTLATRIKQAALVGAAVVATLGAQNALAQAKEQFIGLPSYRVGPYAAGGSGIFGGFIDYMAYINDKEGGVNGVKLVWEECETEYNNARGVECYERLKTKGATGNSVFQPLSTGITYSVLEKVTADKIPMVTIGYGRTDAADGRVFPWVFPMISTYWSQASGMVKFIAQKEGGEDKLKGKKIAYLYHDSAFGKEGIPLMEEQAKNLGYQLVTIPVAHPGNEQQSQWLKIRQEKPDWVILWGWGVMNPTAIKAAAKVGFARDKIVGGWWSGSEEDTIPAGSAATNYITANFTGAGGNFPVIKDIQKVVYGKGKGNLEDKSRVGSIYYNRGVIHGIVTVEAIRAAQEKFGKGKPLTGEQVRWGLEHLNLDAKRLKALGAEGLMPEVKLSCADHEGSGKIRFQQWDGKGWKSITDWIDTDRTLVRKMIEDSAGKYAKEKNIKLRDCAKEG